MSRDNMLHALLLATGIGVAVAVSGCGKCCAEEAAACPKTASKACAKTEDKACTMKDGKACPTTKDGKACPMKDGKACPTTKDGKACPMKDGKACPMKDGKACPTTKDGKACPTTKDGKACPSPAVEAVDVWAVLPPVVAEIDGKPMLREELVSMFMEQAPNGQLPPFFTADFVKQVAPNLVKSAVRMKLVAKEMDKAGVKVTKEAAKKIIEEQIKSAPKAQLDLMTRQLAMQGKSLDQYVNEVASNPVAQKSIVMQKFMEDKLSKGISVTEDEAKKFYAENPKMFQVPADPEDALRASHILIRVDEKASDVDKQAALKKINDLQAQLKANPGMFETLAKTESACPSSKQGGSLGAFQKGQMVPEFEKAVVALKPGEISDVVKTQYGYHLVRRDALRPASVMPYDEVKGQLMEALKSQKERAAEEAFFAALETASGVKIMVVEAVEEAAPAPAKTPATGTVKAAK